MCKYGEDRVWFLCTLISTGHPEIFSLKSKAPRASQRKASRGASSRGEHVSGVSLELGIV